MPLSQAFLNLLADPHAERRYLVTVKPFAVVAAAMRQSAAGNRMIAAPGTFSGLLPLDAGLTLIRPSASAAIITIIDVASDGSWVQVGGVTLADAQSTPCVIRGMVTRYFSAGGYNTKPTDTPANQHYEDGVEVALRFTRSMYSGDTIGGRSIPGYGDVEFVATGGRMDAYRAWGWSGRRIKVELGGSGFARNDFGILFDGLTQGVSLDDEKMSLSIRDLSELLNADLYVPRYRGNGGHEGGIDLLGRYKPICLGKVRNIEPIPLGIVSGRFCYQFHDGPVHPYDPAWHQAFDKGIPLAYASANPGPGQWTLDAARGMIILGGDEPALLTADVIGSSNLAVAPSAARVLEYLAACRLALDNGTSLSAASLGLGPKTFMIDAALPFGVGGFALVSRTDDPDQNWMFGTVTAWSGGSLTINVTAFAGSGTFADWSVTKIGFLPAEIAPGAGGDAFDALHAVNPAPIQFYNPEGGNALEVMDAIVNGMGGFYGFNRSGLFDCGRLEAPTGSPLLEIDGARLLELRREETVPPAWRFSVGYARNFRVMSGEELAEDVRRNAVQNGSFDSTTEWALGLGWSIGNGIASAVPCPSEMTQTIALKSGQRYILRAEVTRGAGSVQFKVGGVNVGPPVALTGIIEGEFTATAASVLLSIFKDAAFSGSIDNIAITASRSQFLKTEYRYPAPRVDQATRSIYGPKARQVTINTLLLNEADALAEQARLFSTDGVARDIFVATTKTESFQVDLGDVVLLKDARYGLAAGRLFVVIALDEDASDSRVTLTLWG
jgi:hypothetical protein